MVPKLGAAATLFVFVVLSSVAGQTFQYSRGWTNGKRDGHRRLEAGMNNLEMSNLERALGPCQMAKLRYVLEGKPLPERLLEPCIPTNVEESEPQLKPRYKTDRTSDPIIEAYL